MGGFIIFWRMGRDSNPRKPCDFNGFQDRRIRPLCHPSKTFFFPPVFQPLAILAKIAHLYLLYSFVFYTAFFRNAIVKTIAPATNIMNESNVPIVNPHDVRKPICASGARNCSQTIRATPYPIPKTPDKAPG